MKNSFGKGALLELLAQTGGVLNAGLTAYLIGGGAMVFRNQKDATKDLDLVFDSGGDCRAFSNALLKLGFKRKFALEKPYADMNAKGGIWEGRGPRLDLFVGTVCNALALSAGMKKRGELFGEYGKLQVIMLSNEDVALLKSVTERPDDADDIARIVRVSGIDWNIILRECLTQSEGRPWFGALFNKLTELRERHGIDAPITKQLLKLDNGVLLRAAYERRISNKMSRVQALAELKKQGFTKKELSAL